MASYADLAMRLLTITNQELASGAADIEIDAVEKELGVRIEGGYRSFLKQFGCGGIGHVELYGLGGPSYLDLVRLTRSERTEMTPALPAHLLPLMNDGGGNLYCLDTRVAGEPPVVFWDHTGGSAQLPSIEGANFSSWLCAKLDEID